jgi:hypothetical protein
MLWHEDEKNFAAQAGWRRPAALLLSELRRGHGHDRDSRDTSSDGASIQGPDEKAEDAMTIKEQFEAIWRELGLHDAHNPSRWVVINGIVVDYFA